MYGVLRDLVFEAPVTECFDLVVIDGLSLLEDSRILSSRFPSRVLPKNGVTFSKGAHRNARVVIRCTIASIICLLLPGTGFPDWGLSGVGDLPYPVSWSPFGTDHFVEVRNGQDVDLWTFYGTRFGMNKHCSFEVPEDVLEDLSGEERRTLHEYHHESAPGHFEWHPTAPTERAEEEDDNEEDKEG